MSALWNERTGRERRTSAVRPGAGGVIDMVFPTRVVIPEEPARDLLRRSVRLREQSIGELSHNGDRILAVVHPREVRELGV